jgi:hypothetical protein
MTARDNSLYVRDCRLCGCPLGFGETADGKWIPLDLRSPVYVVIESGAKSRAVRNMNTYVTHYATCPQASEFSKKKQAPPV